MSLAARTFSVLMLVFVVVVFYSLKYGHLVLVRDGCDGSLVGLPMNGAVHFEAFPPHYACRYRTKKGRIVERSH